MDSVRKHMDKKAGRGGIKCYCCGGPKTPFWRKVRTAIVRSIRRTQKQNLKTERLNHES